MKSVKKELYWHLVNNCGIYLPIYQLDLLVEQLKSKTIWRVMDEAAKDEDLKKYNIKSKGAYSDGNNRIELLEKTRKEVCKLDPETLKVIDTYPSLYKASLEFKKGFGNISRAIKQDSIAYGFRWSYAKK